MGGGVQAVGEDEVEEFWREEGEGLGSLGRRRRWRGEGEEGGEPEPEAEPSLLNEEIW